MSVTLPISTATATTARSSSGLSEPTRLNLLHFFNDGFQTALLWMLPLAAAHVGMTAAGAGAVASVHLWIGVGLAVPAGWAAKRWGGTRILLIAGALYGACFIGSSAITSAIHLWLAFIAAGVAFGVFHPIAFALVAQRGTASGNSQKDCSRAMGRFAAVGDVGRVVVSWAFIALAAAIGWALGSLLAGAAAIGIAAALWNWNRGADVSLIEQPRQHAITANRRRLLSNKRYVRATMIGTLDSLVTSGLIVFVPFLLLAKGRETSELSLFVALLFGGSLVGKLVAGAMVEKWGAARSIAVCQVALLLCAVSLAFNEHALLDTVLVVPLGVLSKACLPMVLSLTAGSLEKDQMPVGFGASQTVIGAATAASPAIAGALAVVVGVAGAFALTASLSLLTVILAVKHQPEGASLRLKLNER